MTSVSTIIKIMVHMVIPAVHMAIVITIQVPMATAVVTMTLAPTISRSQLQPTSKIMALLTTNTAQVVTMETNRIKEVPPKDMG